MSRKRTTPAAAVLIALACMTACAQPRPIPIGTDRSYYGHIEQGEKFGILVGMDHENAVLKLSERGLRDDGLAACTYSLARITGCADNDKFHLLRRRDFLKDGSVHLRILNGKVAAISWSFQLVQIDT